MISIKEKLSLSRSDRFIRALFNEHDGGCSHCHWRPNPTFNDNWRIILSLFFHFAIVLFLSGIQHYQDNTSPRCLSCTTRRDECARRSHNLWLSWQLLCGLCMIFYQENLGNMRLAEICERALSISPLTYKKNLAYFRIFPINITFLQLVIR